MAAASRAQVVHRLAGGPPSGADTAAPTVPQNLVATAISTTQVNLTWLASTDSGGAGLAGYRVLRGGVEIATTAQTNFSDTGLTANTAYAYTVRAYDNADSRQRLGEFVFRQRDDTRP